MRETFSQVELYPMVKAVLTPRELEIANLLVRGLDNQEIAKELSISRLNVSNHIAHIRIRFDLQWTDRIQLVRALLCR
jgi:DNA-binding CsgD family transcriptional regulator